MRLARLNGLYVTITYPRVLFTILSYAGRMFTIRARAIWRLVLENMIPQFNFTRGVLYGKLFFNLNVGPCHVISFILERRALRVLAVLNARSKVDGHEIARLGFSIHSLLRARDYVIRVCHIASLVVPFQFLKDEYFRGFNELYREHF